MDLDVPTEPAAVEQVDPAVHKSETIGRADNSVGADVVFHD